MSFRDVLGGVVKDIPGGIGAILVDDEGEMVDIFTTGDHFEMKLVGAHQAIIMGAVRRILDPEKRKDYLSGLSIRSENYLIHVAPVQEGLYVILLQKAEGLPSAGMRALRKAIPSISGLI